MAEIERSMIIGYQVVEASLLLDFYGNLLTGRASRILSLYYNEDFTLSEIAAELEVSRQSIHDTIKKGLRSLTEYEEKLGLISRYRERADLLKELAARLEQGDETASKKALVRLATFESIDLDLSE